MPKMENFDFTKPLCIFILDCNPDAGSVLTPEQILQDYVTSAQEVGDIITGEGGTAGAIPVPCPAIRGSTLPFGGWGNPKKAVKISPLHYALTINNPIPAGSEYKWLDVSGKGLPGDIDPSTLYSYEPRPYIDRPIKFRTPVPGEEILIVLDRWGNYKSKIEYTRLDKWIEQKKFEEALDNINVEQDKVETNADNNMGNRQGLQSSHAADYKILEVKTSSENIVDFLEHQPGKTTDVGADVQENQVSSNQNTAQKSDNSKTIDSALEISPVDDSKTLTIVTKTENSTKAKTNTTTKNAEAEVQKTGKVVTNKTKSTTARRSEPVLVTPVNTRSKTRTVTSERKVTRTITNSGSSEPVKLRSPRGKPTERPRSLIENGSTPKGTNRPVRTSGFSRNPRPFSLSADMKFSRFRRSTEEIFIEKTSPKSPLKGWCSTSSSSSENFLGSPISSTPGEASPGKSEDFIFDERSENTLDDEPQRDEKLSKVVVKNVFTDMLSRARKISSDFQTKDTADYRQSTTVHYTTSNRHSYYASSPRSTVTPDRYMPKHTFFSRGAAKSESSLLLSSSPQVGQSHLGQVKGKERPISTEVVTVTTTNISKDHLTSEISDEKCIQPVEIKDPTTQITEQSKENVNQDVAKVNNSKDNLIGSEIIHNSKQSTGANGNAVTEDITEHKEVKRQLHFDESEQNMVEATRGSIHLQDNMDQVHETDNSQSQNAEDLMTPINIKSEAESENKAATACAKTNSPNFESSPSDSVDSSEKELPIDTDSSSIATLTKSENVSVQKDSQEHSKNHHLNGMSGVLNKGDTVKDKESNETYRAEDEIVLNCNKMTSFELEEDADVELLVASEKLEVSYSEPISVQNSDASKLIQKLDSYNNNCEPAAEDRIASKDSTEDTTSEVSETRKGKPSLQATKSFKSFEASFDGEDYIVVDLPSCASVSDEECDTRKKCLESQQSDQVEALAGGNNLSVEKSSEEKQINNCPQPIASAGDKKEESCKDENAEKDIEEGKMRVTDTQESFISVTEPVVVDLDEYQNSCDETISFDDKPKNDVLHPMGTLTDRQSSTVSSKNPLRELECPNEAEDMIQVDDKCLSNVSSTPKVVNVNDTEPKTEDQQMCNTMENMPEQTKDTAEKSETNCAPMEYFITEAYTDEVSSPLNMHCEHTTENSEVIGSTETSEKTNGCMDILIESKEDESKIPDLKYASKVAIRNLDTVDNDTTNNLSSKTSENQNTENVKTIDKKELLSEVSLPNGKNEHKASNDIFPDTENVESHPIDANNIEYRENTLRDDVLQNGKILQLQEQEINGLTCTEKEESSVVPNDTPVIDVTPEEVDKDVTHFADSKKRFNCDMEINQEQLEQHAESNKKASISSDNTTSENNASSPTREKLATNDLKSQPAEQEINGLKCLEKEDSSFAVTDIPHMEVSDEEVDTVKNTFEEFDGNNIPIEAIKINQDEHSEEPILKSAEGTSKVLQITSSEINRSCSVEQSSSNTCRNTNKQAEDFTNLLPGEIETESVPSDSNVGEEITVKDSITTNEESSVEYDNLRNSTNDHTLDQTAFKVTRPMKGKTQKTVLGLKSSNNSAAMSFSEDSSALYQGTKVLKTEVVKDALDHVSATATNSNMIQIDSEPVASNADSSQTVECEKSSKSKKRRKRKNKEEKCSESVIPQASIEAGDQSANCETIEVSPSHMAKNKVDGVTMNLVKSYASVVKSQKPKDPKPESDEQKSDKLNRCQETMSDNTKIFHGNNGEHVTCKEGNLREVKSNHKEHAEPIKENEESSNDHVPEKAACLKAPEPEYASKQTTSDGATKQSPGPSSKKQDQKTTVKQRKGKSKGKGKKSDKRKNDKWKPNLELTDGDEKEEVITQTEMPYWSSVFGRNLCLRLFLIILAITFCLTMYYILHDSGATEKHEL